MKYAILTVTLTAIVLAIIYRKKGGGNAYVSQTWLDNHGLLLPDDGMPACGVRRERRRDWDAIHRRDTFVKEVSR